MYSLQDYSDNNTDSRPWYKYPLVWMMIAIPFSAIVMGVIMITLAIDSNDGLVTDDYYKHGLEINRVIHRERKALELGLQMDIGFNISDRVIHARFSPGETETFPDQMILKIQHATRENSDREVLMNRGMDDRYIGRLDRALTPGVWYFELSNDEWKLSSRAMVEQNDNFIELRSGH